MACVVYSEYRPDPFWYGWRLFDKRNVSTLTNNLPNMKRTSSVRAQKKQLQVLERFMREEAHQSYDIFTGTRNETKVCYCVFRILSVEPAAKKIMKP